MTSRVVDICGERCWRLQREGNVALLCAVIHSFSDALMFLTFQLKCFEVVLG